jgi:PAS domain S-box-containing protein
MAADRKALDMDGGARLRAAWLPTLVGIAAALVVVGVGAVALVSYRQAAIVRTRLLGPEIDALVDSIRLRAVSEQGARLMREYLLTGQPEALAEADANEAELRRLLARAGEREETAVLARSLAEAHAEAERHWSAIAESRAVGAPGETLVERFEREILPERRQIDAQLEALDAVRAASFHARTGELDRASRSLVFALVAATILGVLFIAALWRLLRRSVEALRASELRFRTTFENAPVGIALVDRDFRWLRVNPRYREILGHEEEELRRLTSRDLTHPEDVGREESEAAKLRDGGSEGYALEKRYVRKDGRSAWVNVTATALRDPSGAARSFIVAAEDVTARKAFEEELRDAVRARDEFLQVASHELRTPIMSLRLQVESLRAGLGRGSADAERMTSKADAALRQVARLTGLVDDLLEVSQLEARELAIDPHEDDLARTVRDAVARARTEAARRGVELRLDAPPAVRARFDRHRVEQALSHLLSNALKYGQGSPVEVSLRSEGAVASIAVRDRGIGVAPAERERIFARFERAVSARHYGGLGLGLFVARRIAEAHGGTVRLEGEPSQGTTFTIELPLSGPAPSPAGDGARRPVPSAPCA